MALTRERRRRNGHEAPNRRRKGRPLQCFPIGRRSASCLCLCPDPEMRESGPLGAPENSEL